MTFEDFRMISTGASQGDVLAYVGPPSYRDTTNCFAQRTPATINVACREIWTYRMEDKWVAVLEFVGGSLNSIQNKRLPF
jgi:hypothetical protein